MTSDTSLAVVAHGAGDLRLENRPIGRPGPGEVAIDISYGGICGSDLHYYHRGAVGDFALREPMVLGHEVVGVLREVGADTKASAPGTPVAVHPATPCGTCTSCVAGRRQVCTNVRFLGSAARFPHVQGGFASTIVVPAAQAYELPEGLTVKGAALAEPLSVALHAVRRAGLVAGRSALVVGAGPIGCLAVAALRQAGAAEIVAVDLTREALAVAAAVGATTTVLASEPPEALAERFDVVIEASGSPAGLSSAIHAVVRGGTIVQLGILPPGDVAMAGNLLVTREISLVGAFRFDEEFADALVMLRDGPSLDAVITSVVPVADAVEAFDLAGDRHRASKVLLDFTPQDAHHQEMT
jgi:L-idonate 5-dehydrogenase